MNQLLGLVAGILILFGPIIFLAIVIGVPLYLTGDRHQWTYRNPYDRTCDKCGRRECVEAQTGMCTDGLVHTVNRWEVYYPLAHSPELCLPLIKRKNKED